MAHNKGKPNGIGTLKENSLHADLKHWYARPGDELEAVLDGCVIDILRGELLIEIQTRNFSAIRPKLERLCQEHRLHLIHPIARERWIIKEHAGGAKVERRKSPRRGRIEHIFGELVRLPHLIGHPNLSIEVVLTREEEVRVDDGLGSWRRKGWSIRDRRLVGVVEQVVFTCAQDYLDLLPGDLPQPFTARELAEGLRLPLALAQKMVYCLRRADLLQIDGKRGRALLYTKDR
jgi:hypothetical protein